MVIFYIFILNLFLISFEKSLKIDSKYSLAWNNKELALKNLGQYKTAIKW